jgi:hypothetical protein
MTTHFLQFLRPGGLSTRPKTDSQSADDAVAGAVVIPFQHRSNRSSSIHRGRKGTGAVHDGTDLANVSFGLGDTTAAPTSFVPTVPANAGAVTGADTGSVAPSPLSGICSSDRVGSSVLPFAASPSKRDGQFGRDKSVDRIGAHAGPVSRSRVGIPYVRASVAPADRVVTELAFPTQGFVRGAAKSDISPAERDAGSEPASTTGVGSRGFIVLKGGRPDIASCEPKGVARIAGGGSSASCSHSLRLASGFANKSSSGGERERSEDMSQRNRQDGAVLEMLEEAESRLRHGDGTGMRILRTAITDLNRMVQERVLLERAQRIGLTAPTVVRGLAEYQREREKGDSA